MKKIVFIINSLQNPLCIKRIDEFIDNGYDVDAYAFDRNVGINVQPKNLRINVVERISNGSSYKSRVKILYSAIKKIVRKYSKEDVVYYLFGLDITMFVRVMTNKRYIYEESDLVHTYIRNKLMRSFLAWQDKKAIKKSLLTVLTSDGFLKYHFNGRKPDNVFVIPNRLHPSVLNAMNIVKTRPKMDNLRFAFVGGARFDSVIFFANHILKKYLNFEIHFYGNPVEKFKTKFEELRKYDKCYFHGAFVTPIDLPKIYSGVDILISTYDVEFENVRYAEPNKIYEAIYFETPILVSKGTFLSEKVEKLGIGYAINPLNEKSIDDFIRNLTVDDLVEKSDNARKIDKMYAVNDNKVFFEKLSQLLS